MCYFIVWNICCWKLFVLSTSAYQQVIRNYLNTEIFQFTLCTFVMVCVSIISTFRFYFVHVVQFVRYMYCSSIMSDARNETQKELLYHRYMYMYRVSFFAHLNLSVCVCACVCVCVCVCVNYKISWLRSLWHTVHLGYSPQYSEVC